MNSKLKLRVLLTFILVTAYGVFIVDGKLYTFSMWLADILQFDWKAVFAALGVISLTAVSITVILTARLVIVQVFPKRYASKRLKTYDTYEEAKQHCRLLCTLCDESCCPMVSKNVE